MSRTFEILDPADLARRVEQATASLAGAQNQFKPAEELKVAFTSGDRAERDGWCQQASFMRASLNLARLRHAQGATALEVRRILHEGVQVFASVVPLLDYSPFECQIAVPKSQAGKFDGHDMPHDLNQVFLAPSRNIPNNYTTVRVKVRRQPAQIEMKEALLCALIAQDFEAARTISSAYQMQPAVKGAGPNHFGVLREAILANTGAALAQLETIPDGYAADFPPERRELADGVIRGNATLVRKGLKAAATRFKTAWSLKTYCTPAKLRRYGSSEKMLPDIQRFLIGHRWLLSDWTVAWMALAAHVGLEDAFADQSLFNEWIPRELCNGAPLPVVPAMSGKARPGPRKTTLGKRALKQALFKAVEANDGSEIIRLVGLGSDLEDKDHNKHTPLLAAAASAKPDAARALVRCGAHLGTLNLQQRAPLSLAAENGCTEIVQILLDAGAPPDGGSESASPLMFAALGGHTDTAGVLIAAGAEVNRTDRSGLRTPITLACGISNEPMVDLLLSAGADVNLPRRSDKPAIHLAAATGNVQILVKLLGAGASANARDHYEATPLHTAAEWAQSETVSALLAAGAEVDAVDHTRQTPLHWAAGRWQVNTGYVEVIKILLEAGANPNAQDAEGMTPAMISANSWLDRLRVLVQAGSDLCLKNLRGETVFDRAGGYEDALRVLRGAS